MSNTLDYNSTTPAAPVGNRNITFLRAPRVIAAYLPTFGASGGSHAPGGVPDPGASGGASKFLREDATWAIPSGGGSSGITPWSGWVANVTISFPSGSGSFGFSWFQGSQNLGNLSTINPTATQPCLIQNSTTALGATHTEFSQAANPFSFGTVGTYTTGVKLEQTTDQRVWMGISHSSASGLQTDTPTFSIGAFRFSTNVPDTNWQAYVSSSGAAQTVVDTGIPIDTVYHVFKITFTGTSVIFQIDGVTVATITTNIPVASDGARDVNFIECLSGTPAQSLDCAYMITTLR